MPGARGHRDARVVSRGRESSCAKQLAPARTSAIDLVPLSIGQGDLRPACAGLALRAGAGATVADH